MSKAAKANGVYTPNKPQLRILASLVKAGKSGMSGNQLTTQAKLASRAWLSEYLGCKDSINDGYILSDGKRTKVRKLIPAGYVNMIKLTIAEASRKHSALTEARYFATKTGEKVFASIGGQKLAVRSKKANSKKTKSRKPPMVSETAIASSK
jgi:hypothetical protein